MPDNRTPSQILVDTIEHWSFRQSAECGGGSLVVALLIEFRRSLELCDELERALFGPHD